MIEKISRNPKPKKVGALWSRIDSRGQEYFTGAIDTRNLRGDMGIQTKEKSHHIKVFTNKKNKDGDPDFVIMSVDK